VRREVEADRLRRRQRSEVERLDGALGDAVDGQAVVLAGDEFHACEGQVGREKVG